MKLSFSGRFQGYSMASLRKDFISGLIVGVVAIPLAMAFAIASGVKPENGIYTTIIAGIFISLFGGSKFQIGGPTGAFIPILFAVVMEYGVDNLLIAGFLAGVMLVLMGVFKLGTLIKYIPRPVTIGFTAGIAIIIFSGQIANFLGLRNIEKHEEFILNMKEIGLHINTVNIYCVITAAICMTLILLAPKYYPKIPGPLVGLVVSSIVATLFYPEKIATIGSTFGDIPSQLPHFHLPELSVQKIESLLRPAFVIAMLGGIESLLSAVVADGMAGSKHNSNRELIGQGIANIVAPLFGGIPATGAIARTATNIKSGAASPISGVIHGLVVLVILLLLAPYASHIPLSSMAPILMIVAWNMSERKEFAHVLKTRSSDSIILVTTFLLTVFVDLTTAVEVGLILAVVWFVKRTSDLMTVDKVLPDQLQKNAKVVPHMVEKGYNCPQVSIYTVEGLLFFGAAQQFQQSIMKSIQFNPRVLILRMGKVPYMDTTGEANLASIVKSFQKTGGLLLISGLQDQPKEVLKKTGLYDKIGHEHFFEHTGEAINRAIASLDFNQCLGCSQFAFRECAELSKTTSRQDRSGKEKVLAY